MKFSEQQILNAVAAPFAMGRISLTCEGMDGAQKVSDVCNTFLKELQKTAVNSCKEEATNNGN